MFHLHFLANRSFFELFFHHIEISLEHGLLKIWTVK